MTNIDMFK